jgi:hypothetical protein
LPVTLAASAILSACDFFATREFAPKPASVTAFADAFGPGDTVAFRVTEYLARPGSEAADTVLSALLLRFFRAPDSLQGGDGWTTLSVLALSDPPGAYRDEGTLKIRTGDEGLSLASPDSAGGPRFFPLKLAGPAAAPADASDDGFLALPPVFSAGASWTQPLGALDVDRAVERVDTLTVGKRLEESWRVGETIRDGATILARGRFWYGASGLVKGEQAWPFQGRAADGSALPESELRRKLERL